MKFKIPNYANVEEIKTHSHYMKQFLNDQIIDQLRELYRRDKEVFNLVLMEMQLRGIAFTEKHQNNILRGIDFELEPYIKASGDTTNFKKFPFQFFGLSHIVEDLRIESDLFFDYIPLSGFDKYIPNEKKELFPAKLKEYGFELISSTHEKLEEENYEIDTNTASEVREASIEYYVPKEVFTHFIIFCKRNNYSIDDLSTALVYYKNAEGTSQLSFKRLYNYCKKNRFFRYEDPSTVTEERGSNTKNVDLVTQSKQIYTAKSGISYDSMENYIPKDRFSHFIKYCEENSYTFDEIDKAIKFYKYAEGTHQTTYRDLYQYCIKNDFFKHEESCELDHEKITNKEETKNNNNIKDRSTNIENYIPKNVFSHFIDFCEDNGYTMKNIDIAIEGYKNTKGTQKKTYDALYQYCKNNNLIIQGNIVKDLFSTLNITQKRLENFGYDFTNFMYDYFSNSNICNEKPYNKTIRIIEDIYENDYEKFDLLTTNYEDILDELKNHNGYQYIMYSKISDVLSHYNLSNIFYNEDRLIVKLGTDYQDRFIARLLISLLNNLPNPASIGILITNLLAERQTKVLSMRYRGNTLEETGFSLGVTRERIRQIEAKAKKTLRNNNRIKKFLDFILFKYNDNTFIKFSQILKLLNLTSDYEFVIQALFEDHSNFAIMYDEKVLIKKTLYGKLKTEIETLIAQEKLVISIDELINFAEDNFEIAIKLFKEFRYKYFNKSFVPESISISDSLSYILEQNQGKSFKISDENAEFLKEEIYNTFGKVVDSNTRSLFARVSDAKNVVLIEEGTYAYLDFTDVLPSFLNELKIIVENEIQYVNYANPRTIYKNNKELMVKNNVFSHVHLYSLIKVFFSEEFKVGHQNTLYIYDKETDDFSAEELLLDLLKKKSPVTIDYVLKTLGWSKLKLEQLIPRIDSVIFTENQQVLLISDIENDNKYFEVYDIISKELEKGYIITHDLMMELIFSNDEISDFLIAHNIGNLFGFAQFIKAKFSNVRGYSQFLYLKNSPITKIDDVILNELSEMPSYKDFEELIVGKGYSAQTFYKIKNNLIEEEKIIPYDEFSFINTENFILRDGLEAEIFGLLNREFTNKNFITSNEINQLTQTINLNDEYMIQTETIAFFAKKAGYYLCEAYPGSTYALPIITKEDYRSYDRLILDILSNTEETINNEEELLELLKGKGLINERADNLYTSLTNSDLFEFDSLGYFSIKEVDPN